MDRLALLSVVALAACTPRASAYRFRAPLLATVAAADMLPPVPRRPAKAIGQSTANPGAARQQRRTEQVTIAQGPLLDPGDSPVTHLRSLVGARDGEMSSAQLAISALRSLGDTIDADLRGTTRGPDLLALARARGAFSFSNDTRLGDLLVFDHTKAGAGKASLIGIVVRRDMRGVIEFLYLQRGVIRRGFADPTRPSLKRDDSGAVVNTHLRVGKSKDRRGTRYLAGQLFNGSIARAQLTRN